MVPVVILSYQDPRRYRLPAGIPWDRAETARRKRNSSCSAIRVKPARARSTGSVPRNIRAKDRQPAAVARRRAALAGRGMNTCASEARSAREVAGPSDALRDAPKTEEEARVKWELTRQESLQKSTIRIAMPSFPGATPEARRTSRSFFIALAFRADDGTQAAPADALLHYAWRARSAPLGFRCRVLQLRSMSPRRPTPCSLKWGGLF